MFLFETIKTPEQAYCLGLIITDGRVINSKRVYRLEIALQKRDKEVLEFVKQIINPNVKIVEHSPNAYIVRFYSKQMIENLKTFGVIPHKSEITYLPLDKIPKELWRFLILGCFDGDGSIYKSMEKKGHPYYTIAYYGTKQICQQISNIFAEKLDIYPKVKKDKRKKFLHKFVITGNFQVLKVLHFLYDGHNIGMKRKRHYYNLLKTMYCSAPVGCCQPAYCSDADRHQL